MDILAQYEKENPESSSRVPQWEPSEEYGALTRFVIRLSKGKIQNEKQANIVLILWAACMFAIAMIILLGGRSSQSPQGLPIPVAGPSDPRFKNQQMHEK